MCWIYILQSVCAWVWKCGCFLGWGEKRRWGYLHLKEGRWKQCVFISFCVRHRKLAQTDVRYFEQDCNLPVLPEMGKLWSFLLPCSKSRSLAKIWLELEVGNTVCFFHDSDTSFPPPSASGYQDKWSLLEQGSMEIQENWDGPVHVQDSPCLSVKSQSPATLEEVNVLNNICCEYGN